MGAPASGKEIGMEFLFWILAGVGGLVTFFAIILLITMFFFSVRVHRLHTPILEVLGKDAGRESMTVPEITQALQNGRNGKTFRLISRFTDNSPKPIWMKLIGKPLQLYAPDCQTADACRQMARVGLLRNIGNLLPCYQLLSKPYMPPKWP